MNALEKLKETPLPIDRTAYRVVKKARPEDVWRPSNKPCDHIAHSNNVLPTKRPPSNAPECVGRRRGRMVVVGYSKDQPPPKNNSNARWVVRCDCGNYEHRVRIMRWLGTHADDMCRECRNRLYKTRGYEVTGEKAKRDTSSKPVEHTP